MELSWNYYGFEKFNKNTPIYFEKTKCPHKKLCGLHAKFEIFYCVG